MSNLGKLKKLNHQLTKVGGTCQERERVDAALLLLLTDTVCFLVQISLSVRYVKNTCCNILFMLSTVS